MSQIFRYPPSQTAVVSIGAQGNNNTAAPVESLQVAGQDAGGILRPLLTSTDGTLHASVAGVATETTLAAMSAKLPTILGQHLMAASMSVCLASDQSAIAVTQSGTWNINNITGTVSLPTGAATAANQTTGNTSLASIDTKTPALVTGRVPVDGSGVTQPISAASLPLPTGAATSALQTTGNTSLSSIDTKTPVLGQAVMTASSPVVIASNQSAIPASQSGTWNITNVSGTVSLPTGASTSALQTTGNNSLSSIDGKLATLGQKTMTGSEPIVIASDQSAIPVSQSGTWIVQPGNTANTTAWLVNEVTSSTSSVTSVGSSATSVNLLASNANRKNATFYNDSTQILYLKLGATASNTSYTVQIQPGGYYELPAGKIYTGAIDGIWAAANGNARITELT